MAFRSTDQFIVGFQAQLTALRELLPRLQDFTDALLISAVLNGLEYYLKSNCSQKLVEVAGYFPQGLSQSQRDSFEQKLAECEKHISDCQSFVTEAERQSCWSTENAGKLNISWKMFCLEMVDLPNVMPLEQLNLSRMIGNTPVSRFYGSCPVLD
jgi:hypothetical protein